MEVTEDFGGGGLRREAHETAECEQHWYPLVIKGSGEGKGLGCFLMGRRSRIFRLKREDGGGKLEMSLRQKVRMLAA